MNAWPPKPGSTVMTSSRSMRVSQASAAASGVPGLSASPTSAPVARTVSSVAPGSGQASRCTVIRSAPASRNGPASRSGRSIIRCTSRNALESLRTASTSSGPKGRLGTKWLSMMSQCTQSSAGSTMASSAARREKSAERMEAAAIGGSSRGRCGAAVLTAAPGRSRERRPRTGGSRWPPPRPASPERDSGRSPGRGRGGRGPRP